MDEQLQTFYFTFGFGQKNEGKYVVISETSSDLARKRMVDMHGMQWSMQYDESEWTDENGKTQAEQYGYTELK